MRRAFQNLIGMPVEQLLYLYVSSSPQIGCYFEGNCDILLNFVAFMCITVSDTVQIDLDKI